MNGLFWVLVVGVTGWLTEKMIGGKGYGEALGDYTDAWISSSESSVPLSAVIYFSGPSSGRVALLAVMRPRSLAP